MAVIHGFNPKDVATGKSPMFAMIVPDADSSFALFECVPRWLFGSLLMVLFSRLYICTPPVHADAAWADVPSVLECRWYCGNACLESVHGS